MTIYIRWDSFGAKSRKTNLIDTLVHKALVICSPSKLSHELNSIRSILSFNGCPDRVIDLGIQKKLRQFKLLPKEGPQKCPVYLELPWIGNISVKFEEQCKSAISLCYGGVKICIIFSCKNFLGRTSQKLQDRIKQQVSKLVRSKLQPEQLSIKRECKSASQLSPTSYSAIGQDLLENKDCAIHFDDKQLSISANGRSFFHFPILEATYMKTLKPELRRQKQFVYTFEISSFITSRNVLI